MFRNIHIYHYSTFAVQHEKKTILIISGFQTRRDTRKKVIQNDSLLVADFTVSRDRGSNPFGWEIFNLEIINILEQTNESRLSTGISIHTSVSQIIFLIV